MNPNDFHDKAHVWGCHPAREAQCWCEPFLQADFWDWEADGVLYPLAFHRPDCWWLFWDHGEQGPRTAQQTDDMNEHEARLLAGKLGIEEV